MTQKRIEKRGGAPTPVPPVDRPAANLESGHRRETCGTETPGSSPYFSGWDRVSHPLGLAWDQSLGPKGTSSGEEENEGYGL